MSSLCFGDMMESFRTERSGGNDKTQRSEAPCKAGRLRRLHGVITAAEKCRLCRLKIIISRRKPHEIYKRKESSSRWAGQGAAELYPGRIYLCSRRSGTAKILGRGIRLPGGADPAELPRSTEMALPWMSWQKNSACPCMPSEKLFIRNRCQGLQHCSLCFYLSCIPIASVMFGG